MFNVTVVNKHHGIPGEYIGRGSPLGNPFTSRELGTTKAQFQASTQEESVMKYRAWIEDKIQAQDPAVIKELTRLCQLASKGPINLVCFCAPKACHGDVLKEIIEAAQEHQT